MTTSKPYYSIVIKDHMIRFIEMGQQTLYGINVFKERPLPSGVVDKWRILQADLLKKILSDCVKKWKIKGKYIHFSAPDPVVVLRKLKLPSLLNNDDIRAYLYMEIAVFDFHLLSHDEQHTEILLFSAPEHII